MRSFAAGTIVATRHPRYVVGDRVMGMLGWQEYAITDGRSIRRKIEETDLPFSLALGVLGLNGVTAYFALTEIGEPRVRLECSATLMNKRRSNKSILITVPYNPSNAAQCLLQRLPRFFFRAEFER